MRILVLDTETTGLDSSARVMEIAAALYDVQLKTVLWQMASLVPGVRLSPGVNQMGITNDALAQAHDFYCPFEEVAFYANKASCIVAHNASFDRRMIGRKSGLHELPWVCSLHHLAFPNTEKSKKLSHVAVDHGVLVVNTHRAMADVMTLVAIFKRVPDLEAQIHSAIAARRWEAWKL